MGAMSFLDRAIVDFIGESRLYIGGREVILKGGIPPDLWAIPPFKVSVRRSNQN